jgi:hypothetical protein
MQEWYLEYEIHKNRPGLMGDIASLLGMLSINIITINGVENRRRAMLLETDSPEKIDALKEILLRSDHITLTALRPPQLLDRLVIRHGRYLNHCSEQTKTYLFTREDLGLLVDFMAELFQKEGHQLIGIRGMPRVGKSESIVAASVCANKRWLFLSSTLLKQTIRERLSFDEMSPSNIYIIDGIVSTRRASDEHRMLLREILSMPATKVIEHPDVFVRETHYKLTDFDLIIELRNHPDEEIRYELMDQGMEQSFE